MSYLDFELEIGPGSGTSAILVRRGIPAVLAMQYEITDRAVIEMSHAFYEALADGMPVDAAVCEARKAISLGVENTEEWGTPVLYMRSSDGVLFDLIQKSSVAVAPISKPQPTSLPPTSMNVPIPKKAVEIFYCFPTQTSFTAGSENVKHS